MATVNILIIGAGAVGAFYASRLATVPDVEVSVICRSNYAAVKASGFRISSPSYGDYTFVPKHTFRNPDEARSSGIAWDYLVVSTKALPDISDDSVVLEGLVGPETAIVIVQNGLGVEEPYAKRFPSATILSAVTIVSVAQTEPGIIKHNRWTRISIGSYVVDDNNNNTPESQTLTHLSQRTTDFVTLLHRGSIHDASSHTHPSLQLLRWHKTALNASMNPTSVLTGGLPNSTMSTSPHLSSHLLAVMHEVLSAATSIFGPESFPASKFATPSQILQSTRKNTSGSVPSMQLDWAAGRPMELEVILGNPIRIARDRGIEMPRLETMYALLKGAQEKRNREREKGKSKSRL